VTRGTVALLLRCIARLSGQAGSRVQVKAFRSRISGLALAVSQLSRLGSSIGELVIERLDRTLRPHDLHLRLTRMQLLGGLEECSIG
jgi:hypothetical protein